ncbi:MAG TPA: ASCH domain-containing protein [Reyranella sp.]|nr:ASCH domain-containing protein [Reyranella sp.]
MKALSIQQPWAWLIAEGLKDIENRNWSTTYRGPIAIHAGKKLDVLADMYLRDRGWGERLPPAELLPKGGVVGFAEIIGCVRFSKSRWFQGPYGFELALQSRCDLIPCRGQLGLFEVDLGVKS